MRRRAATLVRSALHVAGLSRRLAQGRRQMRIVAVHDVARPEYGAEAFRSQLEFLKSHFSIVPLEEIVRRLEDPNGEGSGEIALTFDDGLASHFKIAFPILQELRLPATFFVCPGLIDRGEWLWNHDLRERLLSLPQADRTDLLRGSGSPSLEVDDAVRWSKTLPPELLESIRSAVIDRTKGFVPSESQRAMLDLMTWDELRSLPPQLVTIGSHSVNHWILPTLPASRMLYEVKESRRLLEERLGRAADHFCYPDGGWDDSAAEAAAATYRSAVTTQPGFVRPGDCPHRLRRIMMPRTLPSLSWRLSYPGR